MSVEAAFQAAVTLQRAGDLSAAITAYRAILEAAPNLAIARENLCLALLASGDYAEGFRLYDSRFLRNVGRVIRPRLPFPEWQGEPLAGRSILVWPEQGYGDQIMFSRFVAGLRERAAAVTLVAPQPLVRLFSHLPVKVLATPNPGSVPVHDYWVMTGSLPGRLGVTLDSLPNAPYLPSRPGGSGIGVVARGDPRHHNDAHRSLPPHLEAELLSLPGAINLHPDATGAPDFQATAELIAGLERIITVDTAAAHLAAAMGKPTTILLPRQGVDWRWMRERADSPWYPSARLLRQGVEGGWAEAIAAIKAMISADGSLS